MTLAGSQQPRSQEPAPVRTHCPEGLTRFWGRERGNGGGNGEGGGAGTVTETDTSGGGNGEGRGEWGKKTEEFSTSW